MQAHPPLLPVGSEIRGQNEFNNYGKRTRRHVVESSEERAKPDRTDIMYLTRCGYTMNGRYLVEGTEIDPPCKKCHGIPRKIPGPKSPPRVGTGAIRMEFRYDDPDGRFITARLVSVQAQRQLRRAGNRIGVEFHDEISFDARHVLADIDWDHIFWKWEHKKRLMNDLVVRINVKPEDATWAMVKDHCRDRLRQTLEA